MTDRVWLWVGFNAFIFTMLVLDLFVFNRKEHTIKVKEALGWTGFWMSLSLLFCLGIYLYYPGAIPGKYSQADLAQQFITGYLIEQALSVDNLFVILMLFTFFRTPHAFQHKVLFWGILGAIFFRILFIIMGLALIQKFDWLLYVLGGFLIFTSVKMLVSKGNEVEPDQSIGLKLVKKIMPVTKYYEGSKFFVNVNGIRHATPLFVVLLVIETTDIIFAMDSIPAIIAISDDPFIVYSSNIFAVLGLRSLYFALAGIIELFHFLHYGLSIILLFIGVKIILHQAHIYEIPTTWALLVTAGLLGLSILLSIIFPEKKTVPEHHAPHLPHQPGQPGEPAQTSSGFPIKEPKEKK